MAKRIARRIRTKVTTDERKKLRKAHKEADAEKKDILDFAREHRARAKAIFDLRQTLAALKTKRQSKGLSLADMQKLTGIGRSALSRLENDELANPTVRTILRVADALEMRVKIVLEEGAAIDKANRKRSSKRAVK